MSPVRRIWVGCLALGAGLIHLGLVAGAPWPLAVAATLIGLAEVGWGIAVFARSAPPLPRVALAGALVPGLAWLGALLVGVVLPAYPLGTATALELALAVVLAVRMRRGPRAAVAPVSPEVADASASAHPLRLLGGVSAGAVVLALVTTPALAATEAGTLAPTHAHFDVAPHAGH